MKIIFKLVAFVMAGLIFYPLFIICSLLSFILWDKKYIEASINWTDDFLESFFD